MLQHTDINATTKHYAHLTANELLITNIFFTVQGEGPFGGWPAVFIRLAGCNYGSKTTHCEFCDTKFDIASADKLSFDEIDKRIHAETFKVTGISYTNQLIVITGGEPMIQKNLVGLCLFLKQKYPNVNIQIETNGSHYLDDFDKLLSDVFIVVSPKASKKGYIRLKENLFQRRVTALKFVVSGDNTSVYFNIPEWAEEFVARFNRPVFVSPINEYKREVRNKEIPYMFDNTLYDYEKMRPNYQRTTQLAMLRNFVVNTQAHLLFGLE